LQPSFRCSGSAGASPSLLPRPSLLPPSLASPFRLMGTLAAHRWIDAAALGELASRSPTEFFGLNYPKFMPIKPQCLLGNLEWGSHTKLQPITFREVQVASRLSSVFAEGFTFIRA
jgi:hypothetical protein